MILNVKIAEVYNECDRLFGFNLFISCFGPPPKHFIAFKSNLFIRRRLHHLLLPGQGYSGLGLPT